MTNEELDRWLAEKVMGWTHQDIPEYGGQCGHWEGSGSDDRAAYSFRIGAPSNDYYECKECGAWQPTKNIAQAIEAAEKAREQGRIHLWGVGSEAASVSTNRKDIEALRVVRHVEGEHWATALCRALYEALREDS